jgi:hypothetical protein
VQPSQYNFTIEKIVPWEEFNEYEGQIQGHIDYAGQKINLVGYIQMARQSEWEKYQPGDVIKVNLLLERIGQIKILDQSTKAELKQIKTGSDEHGKGVIYQCSGQVTEITAEQLKVKSIFYLIFDLDMPIPDLNIENIKVGDYVDIEGRLQIEIL